MTEILINRETADKIMKFIIKKAVETRKRPFKIGNYVIEPKVMMLPAMKSGCYEMLEVFVELDNVVGAWIHVEGIHKGKLSTIEIYKCGKIITDKEVTEKELKHFLQEIEKYINQNNK